MAQRQFIITVTDEHHRGPGHKMPSNIPVLHSSIPHSTVRLHSSSSSVYSHMDSLTSLSHSPRKRLSSCMELPMLLPLCSTKNHILLNRTKLLQKIPALLSSANVLLPARTFSVSITVTGVNCSDYFPSLSVSGFYSVTYFLPSSIPTPPYPCSITQVRIYASHAIL